MNIIVQKYGGTSVESKEKMENICKNIIKYKKAKKDIIVVVSAQGKTTDNLLYKAKQYSNLGNKKLLDFLLSTGEMQSAALISMMLEDFGYETVALTGMQAGIISDSSFGCAKILTIEKENILKHLRNGKIVVVTGFQAVDKMGNITTLGRGGSDLSAVAIASFLGAQKCEIYSDIDGIYTSDPKIIKNTMLVKNISYDKMLEAASNGAKVLHNRCVSVAKKYNTEIIVKNSQKNTTGSKVKKENKLNNINNENSIENTLHPLEDYGVKLISKMDNLSKISIVGDLILQDLNTVSTIYTISKENNIPIYMISLSEIAINVLIDSKNENIFMNQLHEKLIKK